MLGACTGYLVTCVQPECQSSQPYRPWACCGNTCSSTCMRNGGVATMEDTKQPMSCINADWLPLWFQLQVEIMQKLQGYTTPHLPQLVAVLDSGTWASSSQGELLRSLVMRPYCQPLSADDGAPVLAQVAADIASTVDWLCNQRLILHRDISSSNIAKHAVDGQARGVLLDFGASKVRAN